VPHKISPSPASLFAGLCGGVYGLALARYLFESAPQRFIFLDTWGGALLAALLGAALPSLLYLQAVNRFPNRPAPLALAAIPLLLPLISLFSPGVNLLRAKTLLAGSLVLCSLLAFLPHHTPRTTTAPARSSAPLLPRLGLGIWDVGFSLLLFIILLALYLRTLAPTVGEADPFEFQVSAARLGVAHGNGYPLLMLVGKVFSLLPVGGTAAWRINLAAAFAAALAAVGVERLARRLGGAPLPALLAGFTFGVSPSLWARATEIEAYTLNAALAAVILYLGLELVDRPVSVEPRPPSTLYALAFVFGLAMTNHMTTLMLAPACAFAALQWLTHAPRLTPPASRITDHASFLIRHLSFVILFTLLGLSVYLYLPIRWPAVNHGQFLSLQQFAYFLRGGEAAGQLDPLLPLRDLTRFGIVFGKIVMEYSWAGFALMLMGLGALALRRASETQAAGWRAALFITLAYAGHAYFTLAYNPPEPDFSDFFISMHLIAAVLIGLGLHTLLSLAHSFLSPRHPASLSITAGLLPTAFCLLPFSSLWLNLPRLDLSQKWGRYHLGQYTLSQPLARGATLLTDPKHLAPLYYLQAVEGVRPDLDLVLLPDEASYRAVLDERLAAGQTVYLGRYLPGLGEAYSLRSVGPLPEISPYPFTTRPNVAESTSVTLADHTELIGSRVERLGDALLVTLYWRAGRQPQENLLVYLRLRDPAGQVLWQSTGSVPVNGLYPRNAWRPGEYISDFYTIPLAPNLPPGEHRLDVGLFPPFQPSSDPGWVESATVTIRSPTTSPHPTHPLRARLGEQWLMGYDAPESAAPGSRLQITLYWLRGEGETVTAFGETRSLAAWAAGQIVPQVYRLTPPAAGDTFDLVVSNGQAARCGWLAPVTAACALPPIRLEGEGAINFNHQLLLRRAVLETPEVTRAGQVKVTLEWQGLQTMAESYTVFVHLVGPDGRLYGQVDYWPVQGTRLTSSWRPGEVIVDAYAVSFNPDAPPGPYQVHVGMYLLDTLERVPVLNADGAPVEDKVVLSGLTVR